MAQYRVTHSCDHEQTHQLFGKHAARERKLEWLATTLCTDCYRAVQQTQRAAEAQVAAAKAVERGLPSLSGTAAQIEWAERVRGVKSAEFLRLLFEVAKSLEGSTDETLVGLAKVAGGPETSNPVAPVLHALADRLEESACHLLKDGAGIAAELRAILEIFSTKTSAHWWIESRDTSVGQWEKLLSAEKEKAVAAEAARLAKETAWVEKDAAADTLREFFPDAELPFTCEVWSGSDKRVYIGHGFNRNFVTYYHDGDKRNRPGSLTIRDGGPGSDMADGDRENLKEFLASLCAKWKSVKIGVSEKKGN